MNIFEIVKQSVTTRQAAERYGIRVERNGMCRCPFHDDSTPSMKLDRRYYCFGCGATGDVIDFVSWFRGIGSKEAAILLAQDFAIPYEGSADKPSKPLSLFSILSIFWILQPKLLARNKCRLGSTSPLRVPMTTPSSGVIPIDVSKLSPFQTAQVELPLPK